MATLDEVYRKFGEVSEAAQLLETELGNMLIMIEAAQAGLLDKSDPEKASAIFESINRHTLGLLLKKLGKSMDEASCLDDLLTKALEERNRLSHSFYRQHNFRRNSNEGRDLMIDDLHQIHEILLKAYKAVLLLTGTDLDKIELTKLPSTHLPLK